MWSLIDDVLHIRDSAVAVSNTVAYKIAILFKFLELCRYPVHAVLAYLRKTSCCVVPIIGE